MTQAMPPHIRPLDEGLKLCGRARTGIYMEVAHLDPKVNPYELEIAIVDDLKPGDVAVFGCGGSSRIAPWGSLLSTATRARGAAGCITDGFVRDILEIRRMQLPVFAAGIAPLDSKGRGHIAAVDVPVICAGVRVEPGDLVFGDADGVVVVPQAREAEVLKVAFDKINGEHHSMTELRSGGYLRDVYAKYGVL
jgi:regulator of RNase E activity RraA